MAITIIDLPPKKKKSKRFDKERFSQPPSALHKSQMGNDRDTRGVFL